MSLFIPYRLQGRATQRDRAIATYHTYLTRKADMNFMNDSDIDMALCRYAAHPVLSRATRVLAHLAKQANEHSDGWHSWPLPWRAASRLIALIQSGDATEPRLREALAPIKSFYTQRGDAAGMSRPGELAAAGRVPNTATYAPCPSRDDVQPHLIEGEHCVLCGAPK
jgi:hypothetical protein